MTIEAWKFLLKDESNIFYSRITQRYRNKSLIFVIEWEKNSGPLGPYKGPYWVPTKSSRRQQVLAFNTLGKGSGREKFWAWLNGQKPVCTLYNVTFLHQMAALRHFAVADCYSVSLETCSESDIRRVDGVQASPKRKYFVRKSCRLYFSLKTYNWIFIHCICFSRCFEDIFFNYIQLD